MDMYEEEMKNSGKTLRDYIRDLGLDGIEAFVYELDKPKVLYEKETVGVHLYYWPYWMSFWKKDKARLNNEFHDRAAMEKTYLGAACPEEWLEVIRRNLRAAACLNPKYAVWHVSNASVEEAYTWRFVYSDREVIEETARVFNAVHSALPENVTVLFENLWWPGMNLKNKEITDYFFSLIERKNVGIMLDTGHLMNTDPDLENEAQAADYICRRVDGLGKTAAKIQGIHLSCSLSGTYQKTFVKRLPPELTPHMLWKHVTDIDQHRPFQTKAARKIVEYIDPLYVNHELSFFTMAEIRPLFERQLANAR